MSTIIKNVNISFQFIFQFKEIISSGDFAFFSNLPEYKNEFCKMLNEESTFWFKPKNYRNFWKYYAKINKFESHEINPKLAKKAIDYIIPVFLPIKNTLKFSMDDCQSIINTNCFIYPCSIGFIIDITLNFLSEKTIEDAAKILIDIKDKNNTLFQIDDQNMSLYQYIDYLLNTIQLKYSFPQNIPNDSLYRFFCSIAFLDGIYPDYESKIAPLSDVHEWISKLFNFDKYLEKSKFLNLEDYQKTIPDNTTSVAKFPSNLYAEDEKNRVIWMPSHFTDNMYQGKSEIKCYQNNLSMLTMQILNLLIMVDLVDNQNNQGIKIEGNLDFYTKKSVGLLLRAYFRNNDSYKSLATKTLISKNELYKLEDLRKNRYPNC